MLTSDTRRQAHRPRPSRPKLGASLETLEPRQLLSAQFGTRFGGVILPVEPPGQPQYHEYHPLRRTVQHHYPPVTWAVAHPIGSGPRELSFLDNDGKVITGTTRAGDMWSITVHGPGVAIVTDITPNDGILNDEIDTIQLVGTDPHLTYVTGQVTAGPRVVTDGTIGFSRLIAAEGVASIILNGFVLRNTLLPPQAGVPEIALLGGVQTLHFHAIDSISDVAAERPINIFIGDPTTPLTVRPSVRIDHIFNTAVDSRVGLVQGQPIIDPSVNIFVNGQIHTLEMLSVGAPTPPDALLVSQFSPVTYTGRTNVQAFGVQGLKVVGSARNFTLSRDGRPFENGFSGMNHLGHAHFGGNADAVGLDVSNGRIGQILFLRGLGNPTATTNSLVFAGRPLIEHGYPAAGLLGGVVSTQELGRAVIGPAELLLDHSSDPKFIQRRTTGQVDYLARPGAALTNSIIATSGSIGDVAAVGNFRESRIAAGFDYPSFIKGLNPTRQPSQIARYHQRGDLIDSVVSSTYDPVDGTFGTVNDVAGPGRIRGHFNGNLYRDPRSVDPPAFGTRGVGFFARQKEGYLPAQVQDPGFTFPELSRRRHSVLFR
ncbi:hypothetical protein BH23PLA1_BH23PLA1_32020 [soil metagenome]